MKQEEKNKYPFKFMYERRKLAEKQSSLYINILTITSNNSFFEEYKREYNLRLK